MAWGRGGGVRRWRRVCVRPLSPSLILDVVYSPLSFPKRELIASVHISVFHQWLSCCRIILSDCDCGTGQLVWVCSLGKKKTTKKALYLPRVSCKLACIIQRHPGTFLKEWTKMQSNLERKSQAALCRTIYFSLNFYVKSGVRSCRSVLKDILSYNTSITPPISVFHSVHLYGVSNACYIFFTAIIPTMSRLHMTSATAMSPLNILPKYCHL